MTKLNAKHVLIVAGEASGDLHGANLVKAMKKMDRDILFQGIGGDRMVIAGVDIAAHSSQMAVVGLTEVFSKSNIILSTYFQLRSILKNEQPDLLIVIDYPGFNISLAGAAKKFGIPVLYYISPQLWAWRSGRVKKISQRVNRMAVILPFEKDFYKDMGTDMPVDYVGHPLMDQVPQDFNITKIKNDFGIKGDDTVISLLPGSRSEEIKKLLPDMLGAARLISKRIKNLKCLLPIAPTISPELIDSIIGLSDLKVITTGNGVYNCLAVSDLAYVASGTATLETAIMGVPMIITYRISPLSFAIAKRVVKVPHVGLVNLVAGEEVAPELLQEDVVPEKMAEKALEILENEKNKKIIKEKLAGVKASLGEPGASARTAKIAFDMMKGY